MGGLGDDGIAGIAARFGVDADQASDLVGSALTVLTGALAKNAEDEEGAKALDAALERDHDGSVFAHLGGLIGDASSGPGAAILRHVLGEQRGAVEEEMERRSPLSGGQVGSLLETVAPLLLGALGRTKREEGLDAGGIADLLSGERRSLEQQDDGLLGTVLGVLGGGGGGSGGGGGGLLSRIPGMLGGLLGGRKKGG